MSNLPWVRDKCGACSRWCRWLQTRVMRCTDASWWDEEPDEHHCSCNAAPHSHSIDSLSHTQIAGSDKCTSLLSPPMHTLNCGYDYQWSNLGLPQRLSFPNLRHIYNCSSAASPTITPIQSLPQLSSDKRPVSGPVHIFWKSIHCYMGMSLEAVSVKL